MNRTITTRFYDVLDIALAFATLEAVRVPESKLTQQRSTAEGCVSVRRCETSRLRTAADRALNPAAPARSRAASSCVAR